MRKLVRLGSVLLGVVLVSTLAGVGFYRYAISGGASAGTAQLIAMLATIAALILLPGLVLAYHNLKAVWQFRRAAVAMLLFVGIVESCFTVRSARDDRRMLQALDSADAVVIKTHPEQRNEITLAFTLGKDTIRVRDQSPEGRSAADITQGDQVVLYFRKDEPKRATTRRPVADGDRGLVLKILGIGTFFLALGFGYAGTVLRALVARKARKHERVEGDGASRAI